MSASESSRSGPNPSGLCMCGCGEKAPIATQMNKRWGHVTGQPMKYVIGHNRRKSPEAYRIDKKTDCWVWVRQTNWAGYGLVSVANGDGTRRKQSAHRYMYEKLVGPIPEGMQLDHLCRNPSCVNPEHLEPVTRSENQRRGRGTPLTWDRVRQIRAHWEENDLSISAMARKFGISGTSMRHLLKGWTWPEDEDPLNL